VKHSPAIRGRKDCLDFLHVEDTQISLPLMKPTERIMIGTEIFRQSLRANGPIEHPAQCDSIHNATMNDKADNPSGKLIHHR
jgi:hypothetical protein